MFEGYHSQVVKEIPFEGNPTILNAGVIAEVGTPFQKGDFFEIKIETNAGERIIKANRVKLLNDHISI